ncbi:MAG: glycosyltransferase family 4 protein [Oscillospiraceae bacterium]
MAMFPFLPAHGDGPCVSVVSLLPQDEADLLATAQALSAQTFPFFEWRVVHAAGPCPAALGTLAAQDARVRAVAAREGGATLWDTGAQDAAAEMLIFLRAGDVPAPAFLETLFWGLAFNTGAAFCCCEPLVGESFSPEGLRRGTGLPQAFAVGKSAYFEAGGLGRAGNAADRWLFFLRLCAGGAGPVLVGEALLAPGKDAPAAPAAKGTPNDRALAEALAALPETLPVAAYPGSVTPGSYLEPQALDFAGRVRKKHDKINLVMMIPWMVMGGADSFNLSLLAGLDKTRYTVSILTTSPAQHLWQPRFAQVTHDILNLPAFLAPDHYAPFLSYYLAAREADILLISNATSGYYLTPWLRCHFPQLSVADYIHMPVWGFRRGGHARTSGYFGAVLDKTYTCSQKARAEMIEAFHRAPESIEAVYIGVDHGHFAPQNGAEMDVRRQLGIDAARPLVLFPCRFTAQKRPFLMLEVAREMARRGSDAAFVAVGDGPDDAGMRAFCAREGLGGTVYFAGPQADVRPYYAAAAVTLICSGFEGLSLTAYESLAMGTPVLTSDVGGQGELVDDTCGLLVPLDAELGADALDAGRHTPREPALYADALQRLLADEAALRRMGENGRARIEAGFSIAAMVEKMDAEFTRLRGEAAAAERAALVEKLRALPGLNAEWVTLFVEQLKLGITKLALEKRTDAEIHRLNQRADKAEHALAGIRAMRSFKLANSYQRLRQLFGRRKSDSMPGGDDDL